MKKTILAWQQVLFQVAEPCYSLVTFSISSLISEFSISRHLCSRLQRCRSSSSNRQRAELSSVGTSPRIFIQAEQARCTRGAEAKNDGLRFFLLTGNIGQRSFYTQRDPLGRWGLSSFLSLFLYSVLDFYNCCYVCFSSRVGCMTTREKKMNNIFLVSEVCCSRNSHASFAVSQDSLRNRFEFLRG